MVCLGRESKLDLFVLFIPFVIVCVEKFLDLFLFAYVQ